MSQPVANMKQLPDCNDGIAFRNRSMMMHRPVAQRDNHLGLIEHCITGDLLERRFVDQSRDIVLIRQFQSAVELECPRNRQFQCASSVETSGARIGDCQ